MLFKKSSPKSSSAPPLAGKKDVLTGYAALREAVNLTGSNVIESPLDLFAGGGAALTGRRATVILSGEKPRELEEFTHIPVFQHTPLVIQLACGSARPTALNDAGHDAYYALANSGYFQLFAQNVQELLDFSLIAHRIAEAALTPGVCAHDVQFTGQALQTVRLPGMGLIKKYLGRPEDTFPSAGGAQKMLFGEQRRRIPTWFDLDRPVGIGSYYGPEIRAKAGAAQAPFFHAHLAEAVDAALREFAELTGRSYARAAGYRLDDADYVIVAQGALVPELQELSDFLRRERRLKLGILNLTALRPFPGAAVSKFLQGKKGVTILEKTARPLTEILPLSAEIVNCLDKALENGSFKKDPLPYPGYARYGRLSDRPRLYTGVYGLGGEAPSFADLIAVVENMTSQETGRKKFYLGMRFFQPDRRFPKLERLQQNLRRVYPDLENWSLAGNGAIQRRSAFSTAFRKIQFRSLGKENLDKSAVIFSRTLAKILKQPVNAVTESSASNAFLPAIYSLILAEPDDRPSTLLNPTDILTVTGEFSLADVQSMGEQGLLLIQSSLGPEELWHSFPEDLREQIRRKKLRLFAVPAREIAEKLAAIPGFLSELANQALLGALLNIADFPDRQEIQKAHARQLAQLWEDHHALIDAAQQAFEEGMRTVQAIKWDEFPAFVGLTPPEEEAPWTVQKVRQFDETVFDLSRLWDSVGYFYATRHPERTLPDPFLASGVLPARSAAFRDMSYYRTYIPQLLPENCTACGLCWTHCPDAALPTAIQDLSTLMTAAVERGQLAGEKMLQLPRVSGQLAKLAYRIFSGDDIHQYRTLGDLFQAAFEQLIAKMAPKEEQRAVLESEFGRAREMVRYFPIVKTARFFDRPQQREKGSGKVVSINVNPLSCKNCAICVQVCPENALERVVQSEDIVQRYRQNWRFAMGLPDVALEEIAACLPEDHPDAPRYRLLPKRVYHTLTGGDAAYPGSGVKTAVHLFTAAAESLLQPRVKAFINQLAELISQLEAKIQGRLEAVTRINDFEAFGRQLTELEGREVSPEDLARVLHGDQPQPKIDSAKLKRHTQLLNRLKALYQQYTVGANGEGRARLALVFASQNVAMWAAVYPYNPFSYPWINQSGADISALAEGVFEGVMQKMAETFQLTRQAEAELRDESPDLPLPPRHWRDFSEEERALCPPVVLITDGSSLGQSALAGLSRLLSGSLPLKMLVINTSAGMASLGGSLQGDPLEIPGAADASGKSFAENLGLWALNHQDSYVLQSSPGKPEHFFPGVLEGLEVPGPALFHIYAAEPHLHDIPSDRAAEQGRLAVESRAFPAFKYNPHLPGAFGDRLVLDGNPYPEKDWSIRREQVEDSGQPPHWQEFPLTIAHWAAREGRFREAFRPLRKNEANEGLLPLQEYLELPAEQQSGREPYITLRESGKPPLRIALSKEMAAVIAERLKFWHLLQELAGIREATHSGLRKRLEAQIKEEYDREVQSLKSDHQARLNELEQQHWQRYHERLTQRLLELCRRGGKEALFDGSLQEYQAPESDGKTSQS